MNADFHDMLDCADYPIDTPVLSQLNEYQVATIQRMVQMEKGTCLIKSNINSQKTCTFRKTAAGILANRVGSGKTRCALALALSASTPFGIDQSTLEAVESANPILKGMIGKTLETSSHISDKRKAKTYSEEKVTVHEVCDKRTLIIVQTHLIPQWCGELEKLQIPFQKKQNGHKEPYYMFGNVTLASPAFVRHLDNVYYGRVIYDETDAFRSHVKPARITRDFTWLLTATVTDITLKYPFHYILDYFYSVDCLDMVTLKASDDFIDAIATFPPIRTLTHNVVPSRLQRMDSSVPTIMLMTAKQYMENVSYELQKQKKELHSRVNRIGGDVPNQNLLDKIRQTDKKLERIETQITDIAKSTSCCPICMDEPPSQPLMTSCCDTVFCKYCILKCGTSCPYCRHKYFKLTTMTEEQTSTTAPKKRDDVLLDIIQANKSYLLVGNSGDIERLQSILSSKNISSEYMAVKRSQMKDHREGKFQVLIFDCYQFGKGLDMTYCDEIIIYGELNAASLTQICGRLCRLGRVNDVVVHTFQDVFA